ncbi:MAG: GDP-mannose 4,6-dehydratase, partial [Acidimicrobiales bacterium]
GEEATIEQIADAVLDALDKPQSLKTIVEDRPGHDRRYLLDSSKIRDELGWEPKVAFGPGLAGTVEWYAENRSWWEPLLDRAPVVESAWGDPAAGAKV